MKVCACVLLFGIFANTKSFAVTPNINPKSINLEVRTVLEFHDKDKTSDIKLLDDIQNVITEIKTIIDKDGNIKKTRRNHREERLTDFISEAISIINTYEDTAFEDFLNILGNEITQYKYRGSKFFELTENHDIVKFITAKLYSLKGRPTYVKKTKIYALADVLKYENYDNNVKKIVDHINSLYTRAGDNFRRYLSKLEGYGKSKSGSYTDLVRIIKTGLRSIIFDHYTNLSLNTRKHLKHQIVTFWQRYKKYHTSKRFNVSKVLLPYNIVLNKGKSLEPDSRKYQTNTNNNTTNKNTQLYRTKTKQPEPKNKITKEDDLQNETIRHKTPREESNDKSFEILDKVTSRTTSNTHLVVQQWNKIKVLEQTGDVDSLSASFSSLELHNDQKDNTQQFIARVPKKSKIIDTTDVAPKTPKNKATQKNVLWIEQSTGKLPKAVLDILANKTSRWHPSLTDKTFNINAHKHKNEAQKRWRKKVNKPDKTHRKGYEQVNAKTHKKNYNPQNHKTLRYSELIRDRNGKTRKTNEKLYQQAGVKRRVSTNEPENGKTPASVYESENDEIQEKISELENYSSGGKIYDMRNEFERPNKYRIEFESKKELKEDTKYNYKKNLNHNKPTNIKRYETKHGKTQRKVFNPEYDKMQEEIYGPVQDKKHGNILRVYDKHVSAVKNQFMYESEENKKHKPYNTPKTRKPSIVNDIRNKDSLFNQKDEEVQQYKNTKGILRVELKHENQPIRSTTDLLIELGKPIKHKAKGTATTRQVLAFTRPTRLQSDDIRRMKPTHRTSSHINSSVGWLHLELPLKAYSKSNDKGPRKNYRHLKKRTDNSTSIKEGITKGSIEIIDDYNFLKDSYVSKSIKNIERQLNEVKRTANSEEERTANPMVEVNGNVVKPKQVETMSTLNYTLGQGTSKMVDTADNEADILIDYVTNKNAEINDYDVVRGITPETRFKVVVQDKLKTSEATVKKPEFSVKDREEMTKSHAENYIENGEKSETRFRSGVNNIPVDFKAKDKLKTLETAVTKTEISIENYEEKYAENNIENGEKSETMFKSGVVMIPVDFKVNDKLKTLETIDNKTEYSIEDNKGQHAENYKENGEKSETMFKSGVVMIPVDFKVKDKFKTFVTIDNKTEFSVEDHKDQYAENYQENVEKPKTTFKSGLNEIPVDFKVNDTLKTLETAVTKTEISAEDLKDQYAENYIENDENPVSWFRSGSKMVPIENMVSLNHTETAKNETDFIIEHAVDKNYKNNENRIEKAEKLKTKSRSNANNNFEVTQTTLQMVGTAVNKIEHIMENNYTKDKDTNNDKENLSQKGLIPEIGLIPHLDMNQNDFKEEEEGRSFLRRGLKTEVTGTTDNITEYVIGQNTDSIINKENGKKTETNFIPDINMITDDLNDKKDQSYTGADIKTEYIGNEIDFYSKDQASDIRYALKEKDQIEKDTKQQDIDEVTYEPLPRDVKNQDGETLTKDSEIKGIMEDQDNQDFINNYYDYIMSPPTSTTNITSESSSIKGTQSTTKSSATTVVQAAATTPKLTVPVSIPALTSSKAPDIAKMAEFNGMANENEIKLAYTLPDVEVIEEVKSKVDINATNLLSEVIDQGRSL